MYNVEMYNRTARKVVKNRQAISDREASKIAMGFIADAKSMGRVIEESLFDISPRGYVFGQTIQTNNATYDISVGRV